MTTVNTTEERITRKLGLLRRMLENALAGHPKGCRDCRTGPCPRQWNIWNLEASIYNWEEDPLLVMKTDAELEVKKTALLAEIVQSAITDKYIEIAERTVSIRDEYGDESWGRLDEVTGRCVNKLRQAMDLDCLSDTEIATELKAAYVVRRPEYAGPAIPEMTGVEFEVYLGRLLRNQGYETAGTPASHDQGADLILHKEGRRVVVQAKRWAGPVGNKAVQEPIAAKMFYKADDAWLVTNSTFTKSARQLAGQCEVRLVDGTELRSWE